MTSCTKKILAAVFALATLATAGTTPARAQFIGYVSNQSVVATPFTGVASAQASLPFQDIGQGQHFLTYCTQGNATTLTIQLEGAFDAAPITSWSITSNVVTFQAANHYQVGELIELYNFTTSTFFNGVQANVSATGLTSSQFEISLIHANGSGTENGNSANFFQISPAGTNGNSPGCYSLYAGGHFPLVRANLVNYTENVNSTVSAQYVGYGAASPGIVSGFSLPDGVSTFPILGGNGEPVYNYVFNGSTFDRQYVCPSTKFISALGASTAQIVGASAGTAIRVCAVNFGNTNSTATTVHLTYGTGTNCGSSTTQLTGNFAIPANGDVSFHPGSDGAVRTGIGDALCATGSAAGAVDVTVTYAQF